METSQVKQVEQNGLWNGMNKFKVSLSNGKALTFFAKGEFSAKIGDTINYEVTNEQYGNAKLLRSEPSTFVPTEKKYESKTVDTQTSIIRQTCIKAAAEFNAQRSGVGVQDIITDAEILFNWVTKL
jgi:hypothetical protein